MRQKRPGTTGAIAGARVKRYRGNLLCISHSERWELLRAQAPLDEMVQVVVTLLEPYLEPDNY